MQDSTNFAGLIRPTIALALLEALRAADMPEDRDALHETDLPLSLRRRLGLTGVVEKQIKRYSELRDRKDRLSAQELARPRHTIIAGPRGSGKTTLLKMLQPAALRAWASEEAVPYRDLVDYTGVFIPADIIWKKQLEKL